MLAQNGARTTHDQWLLTDKVSRVKQLAGVTMAEREPTTDMI